MNAASTVSDNGSKQIHRRTQYFVLYTLKSISSSLWLRSFFQRYYRTGGLNEILITFTGDNDDRDDDG
uniref:Uncharacterized protein n=1 Tax=Glossina palpalis gambiensis TaxID=67801 RepID=A0A1B0B6N2_9MUSC